MAKQVTVKLSQQSRQKIIKAGKPKRHFIDVAFDTYLTKQRARSANHVWQGWLSPSNSMRFDMCFEEYFDEIIKRPFNPANDNTYKKILAGQIIHSGMAEEFVYFKDMHYARPNYPQGNPEFDEFARKAKHEVAIWHNGFKAKVDYVLEIAKRPAVLDLKNTWIDKDTWKQDHFFDPDAIVKSKELMQICLYAWLLNDWGVYPKKVKEVGICRINWREDPFTKYWAQEVWFNYWDDYREKTEVLATKLIAQWRRVKKGKLADCTNDDCLIHN